MASSKSITIKQVARAAGVSTQTVSRVLNNRSDVSASTRQIVQAVISDMGYSPNAIARSLIQGRSHTLGIVAYGLDYYGPSHTLAAVERQASLLGYSLLLIMQPDIAGKNAGQSLQKLIDRKVDGILWAVPGSESGQDDLQELFSRLNIPLVCTSTAPRSDRTVVAVDNYLGGQMAAEHLIQQGCRRCGVITGPTLWWESQARCRGWCDTLRKNHLPFQDNHCVSGDWTAKGGEAAFLKLAVQVPGLDGVFACNDQMALGVYQGARRMNRLVPDDLAVIGFDDTPESAYYSPPLTTIHQDLDQLGSLAVSSLHAIIENKRTGAPQTGHCLIKPELVVRFSSQSHHQPELCAGEKNKPTKFFKEKNT